MRTKMKKVIQLLLVVFTIVTLVSCAEKEIQPIIEEGLVGMTFHTSNEGITKSVINENLTVDWVAGDKIGIYDGAAWRQFTASSSAHNSDIEGYANEVPTYSAVYPYYAEAVYDEGAIRTVFPATQFVDNTVVAPGALLSVGTSTTQGENKAISFKNVVSLLRLVLNESDKVVSVTLEGKNNEELAGDVTIFVSDAPAYALENGTTSQILKKSDDSVLSGTYYMTLLPQSFDNGFTLTFTDETGRTAVKTYASMEFVRNGGKDAGTITGLHWSSPVQARSVAASSSTLVFEWSENEYVNVADDISHPYRIALYSDSGCNTLVLSWSFTANDASYSSVQPRFVFSGLDAETTYYFKVTDTEQSITSPVVSATTTSFAPIAVSAIPALEGDYILAEDFSELVWGSDEYNAAMGCGIKSAGASMTAASGENPTDSYSILKKGDYATLFSTYNSAVPSTRLAQWGTICYNSDAITSTNSKIISRAGYLMLNSWSGGAASIVTPALASLSDNATIKVSFDAAQYSASDSNSGEVLVSVLPSSSSMGSNHVVSFADKVNAATGSLSTTLGHYEFNISQVEPNSRIAIGPNSTAGNKARMYVDNIKIQIVEYTPVSYDIMAELVGKSSSTATFRWTENNYTDLDADLANEYRIGIYTDAACTSPIVTWVTNESTYTYKGETKYQPCFVFTGLAQNTKYYFRVQDITNSYMSNVVGFTTDAFTVKTIGDTPAAAGDILLAEDFSQLVWGSDEINRATGYESRTFSTDAEMTAATGDNPVAVYRFYAYGDYHSMFYWYKTPIQSTRYKDWSYLSYLSSALQNDGTTTSDTQWDKKINVRAGYVMLGTWSNGNGILVTPPLTNLAGEAKIRVYYKGARYSTDDHNGIAVYVIAPGAEVWDTNCGLKTTAVVTRQGAQWLYNNDEIVGKSGQQLWQSFTRDVNNVLPGSRIGIGPYRQTGKGERMYIDDIRIEVISYVE